MGLFVRLCLLVPLYLCSTTIIIVFCVKIMKMVVLDKAYTCVMFFMCIYSQPFNWFHDFSGWQLLSSNQHICMQNI